MLLLERLTKVFGCVNASFIGCALRWQSSTAVFLFLHFVFVVQGLCAICTMRGSSLTWHYVIVIIKTSIMWPNFAIAWNFHEIKTHTRDHTVLWGKHTAHTPTAKSFQIKRKSDTTATPSTTHTINHSNCIFANDFLWQQRVSSSAMHFLIFVSDCAAMH